MLGRNKLVLPPLLLARSSLLRSSLRGRTEMMNLSLERVNNAGSSLPFWLTLNTLIPRKNCSLTRMRSRADLNVICFAGEGDCGLPLLPCDVERNGKEPLNIIDRDDQSGSRSAAHHSGILFVDSNLSIIIRQTRLAVG